MIVVLAEKPSVARDLAAVLGARVRCNGYFEGNGYRVTWAIGHLVGLAQPHEINPGWKTWSYASLPMLPAQFPLVVLDDGREQYRVVERLLRDASTQSVVAATDAGREGELIFRYIYERAGCKKPWQRLWISSLTEDAIRQAFRQLQPGSRYDGLASAAKARSRADWLVGMNLSRAYTLSNGTLFSVGRVQTPTLAMVVQRDREIRAFVPEHYLEVEATFESERGRYRGTWYPRPAAGLRNARGKLCTLPSELARLPMDGVQADAIVQRAREGQACVAAVERSLRRTPPPLLYDLTELQRHANRLFGFTAKQTLDVAQTLYEKHKLLSYPRTDSRHLSVEIAKSLPDVVRAIAPAYAGLVAAGSGERPLGKRFVDDAKVSDHHALVPTSELARLTPGSPEAKIYDLVCRRLLMAWHNDLVESVTTVFTEVAPLAAATPVDLYVTRGTSVEEPGWTVVERKTQKRDVAAVPSIPAGLAEGEAQSVVDVVAHQKQTQPPRPFTEGTLLTAMETAGRTLDDKSLIEALRESGLGTPATRAATIETLIGRAYLVRDGKNLACTPAGEALIDAVHPQVKSAAMTGSWELRLRRMERGEDAFAPFMQGIELYVSEVVATVAGAAHGRFAAPGRASNGARWSVRAGSSQPSAAASRSGVASGSASRQAHAQAKWSPSAGERASAPRGVSHASAGERASAPRGVSHASAGERASAPRGVSHASAGEFASVARDDTAEVSPVRQAVLPPVLPPLPASLVRGPGGSAVRPARSTSRKRASASGTAAQAASVPETMMPAAPRTRVARAAAASRPTAQTTQLTAAESTTPHPDASAANLARSSGRPARVPQSDIVELALRNNVRATSRAGATALETAAQSLADTGLQPSAARRKRRPSAAVEQTDRDAHTTPPLPTRTPLVTPAPGGGDRSAHATPPLPTRTPAPHGGDRSAPARSPGLPALLRSRFGHAAFRPHQQAVCQAVSDGHDVLVVMPTGAGKSLCYQLPGLARGGTTIVISPLIALIDDQCDKLCELGLRAERIHSGRDRTAAREVCARYLRGELDFLFIAPERLGVTGFPEMLAKRPPGLIAIDEAHCISQWGHDFRPDYRMLRDRLAILRPTPIVALTATATPVVQRDIVEQLAVPAADTFILGFRRDNLAIEVVSCTKANRAALTRACLKGRGRLPAIVYTPTRKDTEHVAAALGGNMRVAAYHAGLPSEARARVQTEFLTGKLDCIVATIAFGMGIDKRDVRTVVHTALPSSLEGYYQEIGRAGRDGLPSRAILLHGPTDRRTHEFFLERDYPAEAELERLHTLLSNRPVARAGLAKRMRKPGMVVDKILEKLWIHGGAVIDADDHVRRGDKDFRPGYARQRAHRLDQLELVAGFVEASQCRMGALIRHFGDRIDAGTACNICDFCAPSDALALALSDGELEPVAPQKRGRKQRRGGRRTRKPRQPRAAKAVPPADAPRALIDALRSWRLLTSKKLRVPAFRVLTDRQLFQLASDRPDSQTGLLAVHGIGEKCAKKHGDAILRMLRAFSESST